MKFFFSLFVVIILQSCASIKIPNVANGDLLFVQAQSENLSGAISRVTNNNQTISFDHIAIVEINGKNTNVLESYTKNGSTKVSYAEFLKTHNQTKIVLYRLKPEYKYAIPQAITKANSMLGKPYNMSYILNENSYYCSDFIERSFRSANIFELKPMTFVNPKTGKTDDFWKSFYSKLGLEVPEGKLGCNPNGLSQSSKIEKIKVLN